MNIIIKLLVFLKCLKFVLSTYYLQQTVALAVAAAVVLKKRPQNREISPPGTVPAVWAIAAMAAVKVPGI